MPATPSKSPSKGAQKKNSAQKSPAKRGRKPKKQQEEQADVTLYDATIKTGTAMATVVGDWIDRYNENREDAALELINYVIEAAGTNLLISKETFIEGDVEDAMEQLEKEKAQEESDYPVVSKKKEMKRFKNNFLDFWKKLIDKCKSSIIFDDYLLDTCFNWFIGISGASLRALRHTVTLAVLQIVTSLVTVATEIRKELESVERIHGGEKKSGSQKAGSLAKKAAALNDKIVTIEENLVGTLFKEVYAHRFRDTFPDIRVACVEELGVWVNRYPVLFLDGTYLKYIGWTLNDRVSEVRGSAVRVLSQRLYNDSENVSQLQIFTKRFKPRIIEIAESDSDTNVQVLGCSLLTEMARLDLLEEAEKEKVYRLVGHESAKVREAVGSFIYENVLREGDEQIAKLTGKASKKGSEKLLEIQKKQLVTLVDFILEYHPIPDMPYYVVEALWSKATLLKEWEALAALINDPSDFSTEEHQNVLMALVNATIHRALDKKLIDLGVPKEFEPSEIRSKALEKEIQESKVKFTRAFAENIADLLETHKGDANKLENLLEMVLFFGTSTVVEEHKQDVVDKVLDVVKDIFFNTHAEAVQHTCARVIKHFADSTEFAQHAEEVRGAIVKELVAKLKACNPKKHNTVNGYELVATLQRLQQLLLIINVPVIANIDFYVADLLGSLNLEEDPDGKLQERSTILTLSIIFQISAWKLFGVKTKPSTKAIDELVSLRDELVKRLTYILDKFVENKGKDEDEIPEEDRFTDAVAEKAYLLATDLMVLFSTNVAAKEEEHEDIQRVVLKKASGELQQKVVKYFEHVLFTEDGLLNERDMEIEKEKEKETEKAEKEKAKEAKEKAKERDDEDEEEESDEEEPKKGKKGKGKGKKGKGKGKGKKGKGKRKAPQKEKAKEVDELVENDGFEEKKEKIQALVLALARAIRFGAMPWSDSTHVIRVYAYTPLLSKSAADVIKELLHVSREQDPDNEWRYAYSALVIQYEQVLKENATDLKEEMSSLAFLRFKELCLRLALTYGPVATKLKTGLSYLVWEGAYYALGSGDDEGIVRYSFLAGLEYFSSRLPAGEANAVLRRFTERVEQLENQPNKKSEDHAPYFAFLENLRKKAKANPTPKGSASKKRKAKSPPQVRKLQYDEEEEEGREEEQREEEEEELEDTRKNKKSKSLTPRKEGEEEEGEEEESEKKRGKGKRKSLDSQEGPRKRGRPRKNAEEEEEGEQEEEEETPKRRGRPRKTPEKKVEEEEGEEEEEQEEEQEETPKRRGRPKKTPEKKVEEEQEEEEEEEEQEEAQEETPKRRGRPRKTPEKKAEEEKEEEEEEVEEETVPKGKKPKTTRTKQSVAKGRRTPSK